MLGDRNNSNFGRSNNGSDDKPYAPTVYSNYKMNNLESSVGTTALRFSYWQGLLRLYIVPCVVMNGNIEFQDKNTVAIHINHTKARILSAMIKEFINSYTANGSAQSVGVTCKHSNGTESIVNISDGTDFGIDNPTPVVSIKVFQSADGSLVSSANYQIKSEAYFGITGSTNPEPTKFDIKTSADNINFELTELYELVTVLDTFVESMTNADAYSVMDQLKWNDHRINKKLTSIQDSLGITKQSSGRGGSMFNSRGQSNVNSYTNLGNDY